MTMRQMSVKLQSKLLHETIAVMAVVSCLLGSTASPVVAAPPTVTPSPGYDARLAERRAAMFPPATISRPRLHVRRPHKPLRGLR
ncbi:hypothetical protein [Rhodopseudomonas sp. P2A-2r]|uniref:hypothetical protein n=1 Tax=unclassified Rhodopseudomonas TaxID=2638247 RepID=UPI00223418EC|nr:hypothetical protein [Rhodopseudomonas sp. P2A-2r]UZE50054.1 hypothetical protein ONR75_04605 [Rhodopseudomonas sp. P2A-2r]